MEDAKTYALVDRNLGSDLKIERLYLVMSERQGVVTSGVPGGSANKVANTP